MKFFHDIYHAQQKRIEIWKRAYEDEKRFREDAEVEVARWTRFVREVGVFHPRGEQENQRAEEEARREEEQMRQVEAKRAPKAPPPDLDVPQRVEAKPKLKAPPSLLPQQPIASFKVPPGGMPLPKTACKLSNADKDTSNQEETSTTNCTKSRGSSTKRKAKETPTAR